MMKKIKNWLDLRAIRKNDDWESDFFHSTFNVEYFADSP